MAKQKEFDFGRPKVQLIDFTGKDSVDETWYAADILLFTKSTRLEMNPQLMEQIRKLPNEEKERQLQYMASTIPSSWEFVDVTFLISGVTRATAQQITRTRSASYAMQSQRVTDVSNATVTNPISPRDVGFAAFEDTANIALREYQKMIDVGVPLQDARGILPMNITCNLVAKYNLRSFVELVQARLSLRTQSEYRGIVQDMRNLVLNTWPWADPFFQPPQETAINLLEDVVSSYGLETGRGPGWKIAKAIDLLRKSR